MKFKPYFLLVFAALLVFGCVDNGDSTGEALRTLDPAKNISGIKSTESTQVFQITKAISQPLEEALKVVLKIFEAQPIKPVPLPSCTDSDGGKYVNVFGETCDASGCQSDYCVISNQSVFEYYCEENSIKNTPFDCANGCIEGACVGETLEKKDTQQIIREFSKVKIFDNVSKQKRMNEILVFGEQATKFGSLEVIHFDDFNNNRSENQYFLRETNGKRSKIYFIGEPELISGTTLQIFGKSLQVEGETEIVPLDYEIISERSVAVGEENPNLGEQRTLVVLVNSQENPIEPLTIEEAWSRTFDELIDRDEDGFPDSINAYVKEVSYEKAFLTGDVIGWHTLPINENALCSISQVRDKVIEATDSEIYFPNYKRLILVFPQTSCGFSGMAYIGMQEVDTADGQAIFSTSFLNGVNTIDNGIGAHELGHNFGVHHANDWECGEFTIGDNCESIQYGDLFDTMGSYGRRGHFNAIHKETIGWLDPSNIIETNHSGAYIIEPIETPSTGLKALKIPTQNGQDYYVEYRRPIGYDTISSNFYGVEIYDGAILHMTRTSDGLKSQLLDTTPHISPPDLRDPNNQGEDSKHVVLRVGETFYDPINDIVITALNLTDEYLEVYLGRLNCGDGIIDSSEDCDGTNLNGNTCQTLGYRKGNLMCTPGCRFDLNQCSEPICGSGNIHNGGNSCTAVFTADPEDSIVRAEGLDWDNVRKSETGFVFSSTATSFLFNIHSDQDPANPVSTITRASVPFDTSSLPDTAIIDSAELTFKKSRLFVNTHPDSNDFITVVPTTLKNLPFLTAEDFDQFSSVENPVELANRVDISHEYELSSVGYIIFTLNSQGLVNINKTGYTGFGLRVGYDLYTTPNNAEYTDLMFRLKSGNAPSSDKPRLKVNYFPFCGVHIDNEDGTCTAIFDDPVEDGYILLNESLAPNFFRHNEEKVIMAHSFARGYAEWDISSIPDTATILKPFFGYHSLFKDGVSDVREMSGRPSVDVNKIVYTDAGDGIVYVSGLTGFPEDSGENYTVNLGLDAREKLISQLSEGWFAMGFSVTDLNTSIGITSKEGSTPNMQAPTLVVNYTPFPVCGNNFVEEFEECDDGNTLDGDGCSTTCITEFCGDGTCNDGENCGTCSTDCGVCPGGGGPGGLPVCGDGICASSEFKSCPGDCLA